MVTLYSQSCSRDTTLHLVDPWKNGNNQNEILITLIEK